MLSQARVLFVDDEEFLLELIDAPLVQLCQSVQFYSSPLAALDVFKKSPDSFDILITDFIMPKMLGTQLIAQAKSLQPDLRVVLATGNSSFDLESSLEQEKWSHFCVLPKPYSLRDLEHVMKKLLD